MAAPKKIKNRYEIKGVLGQGGMGVVYQALDTDMNREVALKTIRDAPDRTALELFRKECAVLAPLSHPNIIEIFDIGEFDESGERRPFFVMPLLQGQTLDNLIRNSSHRLTVERAVEIMSQACRGLHAAHERGLVHRDLKPSNIFVLKDDSVKIIDFGIAHMADTHSTRGHKGTLLYMSPEQLEMKPISASSDIFSLGVVCYETLTQRRPFEKSTPSEVIEAILHEIPPLATEFNPGVSTLISRVIHKAMAKEPLHRFSTAREFAETLQKAQRNEPIEIFDSARIQPRIERAQKAFEQEDYEFAGEILSGLESEGHIDPGMVQLRRRIDQAARQKRIRQLLESARTRFEQGEDPLALQKVEEALELERDNVDALALKRKIEGRRSERQIESWLGLADQHIKNRAYSHARQALQNVLQINPKESRALRLLADVNREEQDYVRLRKEKEQRYQAALEAWQNGEVSTALEEMEEVLALDRRAPDTTSPERGAAYQSFYNQVRSGHDALQNGHAEARKLLAERNFPKALALCDQFLAKYPRHPLFKALKYDVQAQQRQALSAYIADIDRRVEAEPDLDKRLGILREALAQYPGESHFERSLRDMQERHELVDSIVAKARLYEERGQFAEALGQWEILRTIYPQYPGLAFELERLTKRRDQQSRSQAKARWVEQIDSRLVAGDYSGCLELLQQAQREFPNDHELSEIEKLAKQGGERAREAEQFLAQGQQSCAAGRWEEGLDLLRKARQMDERNLSVRAGLVDSLAECARRLVDADWRAADRLAQEAQELDPGHPVAKGVRVLVEDRKRQEFVDDCVTQVRRLQASGDTEGAFAHLERGLSSFPQEERLIQLRDTIQKELGRVSPVQARRRHLEQLKRLSEEAESAADPEASKVICHNALELADQYRDDQEFSALADRFRRRLQTIATPVPVASPPWSPQASPDAVPAEARPYATPPVVDSEPTSGTRSLPRPVGVPPVLGHPDDYRGATAADAAPVSEIGPPTDEQQMADRRRRKLLMLIASVAVIAVVYALLLHRRKKPPVLPPASPTIAIDLTTNPPGALIRIDGQDRGNSPQHLELAEGNHQLKVLKEGYQTVFRPFPVSRTSAGPVTITLQPLALKLQIFTGLKEAQIQMDGQPAGDVKDGTWALDAVEPGSHTLTLSSNGSEATVSFEVVPAAVPPLSSAPTVGVWNLAPAVRTKGLSAVTITTFAGQGHVQTSSDLTKFNVDNQPLGDFKPEGIELPHLSPRTHTLAWEDGGVQQKREFESGPAPILTVVVNPKSTNTLAKVQKPRPAAPSARPQTTNPETARIVDLQNRASEASNSKRYAEPADDCAIGYASQLLQLDPESAWAKNVRDWGVYQEKLLFDAALSNQDLSTAKRIADALERLLPGRQDVIELQNRVKAAAEQEAARHRPAPPPSPVFSIQVQYALKQKKYPGTLVVVSRHIRFAAEPPGESDSVVDVPCSEVAEVTRTKRVLGHGQPGLRVRTRSGASYEFVSRDDTVADKVSSACNKQ
jgi:serine/threonine-protein kinase